MRRAPINTLRDVITDAPIGAPIALPEATTHYLYDVLRLTRGEQVELFDGAGLVVVVTLSGERDGEAAHIVSVQVHDNTSSCRAIVLCQAIPKGDRWEWILEKSTELGVEAIVPITSARTIVKIAREKIAKKSARWTQIIEGAARQSGRQRFPTLHAPGSMEEAWTTFPDATHIVASLHHDTQPLSALLADLPTPHTICVWAGPEGGWTGEELLWFERHGAHFTSLGPRILRSDTAALSLITLAQHLAGDLT